MSRSSHRRIPTLMAVALLCAAPALQAAPVAFEIAAASITIGSGYGVDDGANGENGGTRLDVGFTPGFSAQSFVLNNVGDRFSFDLVTVGFNEPNTGSGANKGIHDHETDGLGLSARFDFNGPVLGPLLLTGTGTATPGAIDDVEVDYTLAWTPVVADFAGGRFRFSVDALSFTNTNLGAQTARATVELLPAPGQRVAAVPEPASAALVGLALAAAGVVRRRRAA